MTRVSMSHRVGLEKRRQQRHQQHQAGMKCTDCRCIRPERQQVLYADHDDDVVAALQHACCRVFLFEWEEEAVEERERS
jgi:hypothetical protein